MTKKTSQAIITDSVNKEMTTIDGFTPDRDVLKHEIKLIFGANGVVEKLQERIHKLAVLAAIDWLKHMQPDMPMAVIAGAAQCKGSQRVQALVYWFEHAVGCKITIGKDGSVKGKKNKDKSFNWDRDPVAILDYGKDNPYFRFAPEEQPLLKTPSLQKNSINFYTAGRGLRIGTIDEKDLDEMLASAKKEILSIMRSSKTGEWAEKYCEQEGIDEIPSMPEVSETVNVTVQ